MIYLLDDRSCLGLSDACPPSVEVAWKEAVRGQASDNPKNKRPDVPCPFNGCFMLEADVPVGRQ